MIIVKDRHDDLVSMFETEGQAMFFIEKMISMRSNGQKNVDSINNYEILIVEETEAL